jgi:hypothetical protein
LAPSGSLDNNKEGHSAAVENPATQQTETKSEEQHMESKQSNIEEEPAPKD